MDCGPFQGYKYLRHETGYLLALLRDGFHGPSHATTGTAELCTMLLPDSGHLQEEEARYAQHQGASIHIPPLPLYTAEDAVRSLKYFRTHEFDQPFDVGGDVRATILPAGHILGAAQIHLSVDGSSIHFTGDLGRSDDPLKYPAPGVGAS